MNIIAGEPVPPGFEDEVNREPEIQAAIDQYKGNALVGLEYTLELHEDDRREPGYFCILCDKRGDPRTIMQHWTSFNHRLRYLEKHYPTASREFNPVKYKPNSHQVLLGIVQRLAEAIEEHHGRLKLMVCSCDDFRRSKSKYVAEVNGKFHYDERNGPNFVNLIDHSLWESNASAKKSDQMLQITIKAPKRPVNEEADAANSAKRDDLDEISSDSDSQMNSSKKAKKLEQQSPAYRVLPRVRRSPPFEEERSSNNAASAPKKLPTPKELSLQASHIAQEKYKWEKYRCMLEIQLKQMERFQEEYEKNPEKHPLYPEEWKKFWNRRYKELQSEKKNDPNKYDYKPEWIVFWTKRMKDLFNAEVDKKKKEIKIKLGLPENAEETVDQLKEKYKVQVSRNAGSVTSGGHVLGPKLSERKKDSPSNGAGRAQTTTDVIDISDDDSPNLRRERRTGSRSRSRSRRTNSRGRSSSLSKSPLSDEYERRGHYHGRHHRRHVPTSGRSYPSESDYYYGRSRYAGMSSAHYGAPVAPPYRVLDSHQYPKYERSPSPNSKSTSAMEPEAEDEGPLTVVAVLRLLTALEEHLGSLGPKVVDLLGKALALEKVKANSADDLLLNDDHCVFFETIKEKLKGLLIADVVEDQQKVRAVKKAIKNIAAAIHQVTSKGNAKGNKTTETNNTKDNKFENSKNIKKKAQQANLKDLPFDRQVVATKLAAALVMQGREDVSTEDMDKLIFMFLLMVKLSKSKVEIDGSPLVMNDVLSELGIHVPSNKPTAIDLAALPAIVDELFENRANILAQDIENEISNSAPEKETKNDTSSNMLESLTDSDLQTLLQNFKHLSSEEQHHLIAHLKKLETADPGRVEKLRKFVNLSDLAEASSATSPATVATTSRGANQRAPSNSGNGRHNESPGPSNSKSRGDISDDESNDRRRGINVSNPNKFSLDDEEEDDDYNVDDVFKAAFNKVSDKTDKKSSTDSTSTKAHSTNNNKQPIDPIIPVSSSPSALTFNPAGLNISLSDTQNLIANLMGSLQQSNANKATNANSSQSNMQAPTDALSARTAISQQHSQVGATPNMPYYQQGGGQQQSASYGNGFNQMSSGMNSAMSSGMNSAMSSGMNNNQGYYNNMSMGGGGGSGGYGNMGSGYGGYQPWVNDGQQQYGMQNYMPQQQQQQSSQQQMGYNMYGRGAN